MPLPYQHGRCGRWRKRPHARGRLEFQVLEHRRLLAADAMPFDFSSDAGANPAALVSMASAEGEPAPDLVAFAKLLASSEVKYFAAAWDADSTAQAQLFGDGADDLPFIEVTGPDRQFNDVAAAEEIDFLPTWEFPDGSRFEGVLTLAEISSRSEIDIPTGEAPSFETIADQIVRIGSPLHIPVDAYDPNGDPLTVTVSVEDPDDLEAIVLSGNRSIRIDMDGFGDMVFELFEQRAPLPTGRVIALAESDFYDGIIFHRVTSSFVIQGGDPTGTGTSGSELGIFDDQFHPDLQHNRSGVLSFAKNVDDSNNSQFFILESPARHLDFNHSVFGQLVEGEDVREAISQMQTINPTANPPNNRPVVDISMTTIDVFDDRENAVIMLKAKGDTAVTTMVTVTVTDTASHSASQTFLVSVQPDNANSQPFLQPLDVPSQIYVNQTLDLQVSSVDLEGDRVFYDAARIGGTINAVVTIDHDTGALSVTPAADAIGQIRFAIAVAPGQGVVGNSPGDFDRQDFVLDVVAPPPFYRVDNPPDVDGISGVSALDALLIINAMFDHGGEIDLSSGNFEGLNPNFMYNVNGDTRITALDALQVINALAKAPGESQQPATDRSVSISRSTSAVDLALMDHGGIGQGLGAVIDFRHDQDDRDDLEDWISLLAEYQLGLQTIG